MADNFAVTPGAGGTVATDDVGGAHYQRVKISDGTADSSTHLKILAEDAAHSSGDTGIMILAVRKDSAASVADTDGDYLPLSTDANGKLRIIGDVVQSGSWTVNAAQATASSLNAQVVGNVAHDGAASGNPVQLAGYGSAAAPTDVSADGDVTRIWTTLKGAINVADAGGSLTVDVGTALPAGTNAIGKLAANSGVDIGDVDILSIAAGDNNIGNVDIASIAAGDNNIGNVDVLSVIPGTGATNLGKAIDTATGATDTGVLALATRDDALSALTPAESDNVQLRVDANGALWTHDDALDAAISGSELQVDVVGALPAGTNAIGKLAANSGVDIGDVDVTSIVPGTGATNLGKAEDAAHSSSDTGVMALGVRVDTPNATVAADGDYHYVATDKAGGLRTALYETDFAVLGTNHVKKYYTNSGAVTDGIVWSPAAGKRWYVTDLIIQTSAAATVTLEDDLSGGDSAVMKFELAANSGVSHSFNTPLFSGEDAADLLVTTSAGNIYICITGYEI